MTGVKDRFCNLLFTRYLRQKKNLDIDFGGTYIELTKFF